MPDARLGEKMCAFVIPHPGKALSLDELVQFFAAKDMAKFKLPERLEIVNEFPVSTFGKVSKKALAETVANKLEAERGA